MARKITGILLGTVLILFFFSSNSYCQESGQNSNSDVLPFSREIGFYTGWADGNLKVQNDYEMVPLMLRFGFNAKPFFKKINLEPPGMINFLIEPFINPVVSPDRNVETGCNFLIKYRHPITKRFNIFVEMGLGLLYTTQHTREQGTQFNFSEQGGGGFGYLFAANKSIDFAYRFRHFSNCGIDDANGGVDVEYYLCGISVFY